MLTWSEIVIRLSLASFFGAVIGLERERKDWAAGLRTHMLVCVGSSLIMMVSAFGFADILGNDHVTLDPSRVAAQVISGIGFIGAGAILFQQTGIVRGLTTAAGLWTVAAIGLATGGGMYFAAGVATLIAIIILWILQPLEHRISKGFKRKSVVITVPSISDGLEIVKHLSGLQNNGLLHAAIDKAENKWVVNLKFSSDSVAKISERITSLSNIANIEDITWIG
jgi:putative Mg2+ transporter-C (MgtC) family protein